MAEVQKIRPVERQYEEVEEASLRAIHEFLTTSGDDPGALAKAKVAQGALASVQSHFKTEMSRRSLDFEMARALTTDQTKLAEYVRLTQPASALTTALPAPKNEAE